MARKVAEAERLRRIGNLEASESACREALEMDPEHRAGALAALGAVLNDQGRLEGSFAAYQESLGQQTDQPLIYLLHTVPWPPCACPVVVLTKRCYWPIKPVNWRPA